MILLEWFQMPSSSKFKPLTTRKLFGQSKSQRLSLYLLAKTSEAGQGQADVLAGTVRLREGKRPWLNEQLCSSPEYDSKPCNYIQAASL